MKKIQDFSFYTFWKKTSGPRYTPAQGGPPPPPTWKKSKISKPAATSSLREYTRSEIYDFRVLDN